MSSGPCTGVDACDVVDATSHRDAMDAPASETGPLEFCAPGPTQIYLVSDERGSDAGSTTPHLRTFDPTARVFSDVGPIVCGSPNAHVWSLAVSRMGDAWIVADTGAGYELWQVSLLDAACLGSTPLSGFLPTSTTTPIGTAFGLNPGALDSLVGVYAGTMPTWDLVTIDRGTAVATLASTFSPSTNASRGFLVGTSMNGLITYQLRPIDTSTSALDVFQGGSFPVQEGTLLDTITIDDPRRVAGAVLWGGMHWVFLAGSGTTPSSVFSYGQPAGTMHLEVPAIGFVPWAVAVSLCAPGEMPL
jgi:hypothetical protein